MDGIESFGGTKRDLAPIHRRVLIVILILACPGSNQRGSQNTCRPLKTVGYRILLVRDAENASLSDIPTRANAMVSSLVVHCQRLLAKVEKVKCLQGCFFGCVVTYVQMSDADIKG